ncbi:TonB-dependent receptor domain-containing protein, partial [Acinetobacter baumannii]|uniref:TonB-dependent receptor domain-containing protein n=1 Tax=Acinetobacter baumannii TaxID=470 RepID=UPI001177D648
MPGMLRAEVSNIDATIAGAEMGASYRFTSNWKGDASLAYAWGKNRSDDRAMPQIPPLEGRLGLTYERDNWSTSGLWRVVAAQNRVPRTRAPLVGKDFDESAMPGMLRAEVSNIDATIAGAEMGASYRFTSNWKG